MLNNIETVLAPSPSGASVEGGAQTSALPSTLYDIEESLQALLDTEELVSEDQAAEYFADLARMTSESERKRSNIIRALVAMDEHVEGAKAQITELERAMAIKCAGEIREVLRLEKHIERKAKERERLEGYVLSVLRMLPRGRQTLSCSLGELKRRSGSPSVEITDIAKVPWRYRRVTIKNISGELFAAAYMKEFPELEDTAVFEGNKLAIRAAIDAGTTVDGAEITYGPDKLVMR